MGAKMKLKLITGSLLAAASLLVVNPASAEVVGAFGLNDNDPAGPQVTYDADVLRINVTCVTCSGALSDTPDGTVGLPPLPNLDSMVPGVFDTSTADLFSLENSSVESEIAAVNAITGESYVLADFTKVDGATNFSTDAEYILIKIGADPNYALIRNDDSLQAFLLASVGQGSGISHVSFFGATTTTVSEPGILALFGVGVLLLGFMRRRAIA
jgi:hypothetical protein